MQIIEQNIGPKIPYTVDSAKVIFDGKIVIDCNIEQEEVQKTIDISFSKSGELIRGVGEWYVANIIIPPKEFRTTEKDGEEIEITALPVNMDRVVLILWTLPERSNE